MDVSKFQYRKVKKIDFDKVTKFVDKWLSGRAIKEGGGNDYFVSYNQHKSYFKNCHVWIIIDKNEIIGWGVKEKSNILIHLLISAKYRGLGLGAKLLKIMNPDIIRSKSDQMTGDPKDFYIKMGYKTVFKNKTGKKKNIDLLTK